MVGTAIQATQLPIRKIFHDDYRFTIPRYQRGYAWTTEEAGELFQDLQGAAETSTDPYFLGSIVLVKHDTPDAEIIDGQQRLITLTVLFSVLRLKVTAELAASLTRMIFQAADAMDKTVDQPRLKIRDQEFFGRHIQALDGIKQLGRMSLDGLNDSETNLVRNAWMFQQRLAGLTPEQCANLARFIGTNTILVVASTQGFDSAFRVFTVLNERGLSLTHSDILKSEIIGKIPNEDQAEYTRRWEEEEETLGRRGFADLFSQIRTVYTGTKSHGAVLKEFRDAVLRRVPDGKTFIDDVLVPYAQAYDAVKQAEYRRATPEINEILGWLKLIERNDWVPPAIGFLARKANGADEVKRYLALLERLTASMYILDVDKGKRVARYRLVLDAIAKGNVFAKGSPIELTDEERHRTLQRIGGEIYKQTPATKLILLRLDAALSAGGVRHEHRRVTIEHVLPQRPPTSSKWRAIFDDEARRKWQHRLANLVLLTSTKNQAAANLDFEAKKQQYFAPNSVSTFALTSEVLMEPEWTPEVLQKRQTRLIEALQQVWRL